MKFGTFFEVQTPEPFTTQNEYNALWTEVRQVELVEKLGFDYAWTCEHHGLGIRAHCSAPEVYLAAISQRTERIRLGHAIIELVPQINHVVRVAERLATLDLLSHGRVDAGLGRTALAQDIAPFRVDSEEIHDMWLEGVRLMPRLWTEDEVSSNGKYYTIPPCNIVPKPYQKPHIPLWTAVIRQPSWAEAGRLGMGVLSTPFSATDECISSYREAIKDPEPAVQLVNNQFGVMIHVYCHQDDQTGIDRGVKGEEWVQERLHPPGYKHPSGTPSERVYNDTLAFGDPQRITEILKRWEARGADQILCWFRYGMLPEDQVEEGVKLFAEKVMPNFQ